MPDRLTPSARDGEFLINTTTIDAQISPTTTALADGGFLISWTSAEQDGSGYGIYAQRYSAAGERDGSEFLVNGLTLDDQVSSAVTALASGGFLITWASYDQDASSYGTYAQIYASDGTPVGALFQANTYTDLAQNDPTTTALADGGFLISWSSNGQDGSGYGVYAQRFDSVGTPLGSEFPISMTVEGDQFAPAAITLDDGSMMVSWTSDGQDGGGYGVFARHFANDGSAIGGEFQVNTSNLGEQSDPSATALTDGGFVVAWQSFPQDSEDFGVAVQIFDNNGNRVGLQFQANTIEAGGQSRPSVTALPDGGFVVTWQSPPSGGIAGQRFRADGGPVGDEFQISATVNEQTRPTVTTLADGAFVVAWQSPDQDGNGSGVYARIFDISDAAATVTTLGALTSDGAYKSGDALQLTVTFDQAVTVDTTGGTPSLLLETGAVDRQAIYVSGSGTDRLVFQYVVQDGDASADLDAASATALALNGGSIVNDLNDTAVLTLPAPGSADSLAGQQQILVDGIAPAVASVTLPADGSFATGETLRFAVTFAEAVTVDSIGGMPRLLLTLDSGGTVAASFSGGSGTTTLFFDYIVQAGQQDTNGLVLAGAIDAHGGTLRDLAGNDASLTLQGVPATAGLLVDGVAPSLASVALPADATYHAGQALDFTVSFSEAVTLDTGGGLPRIAVTLDTGGTIAASYVSGSGSDALVFRYIVQAGQADATGLVLGGVIDLRGASLRDLAGNDAGTMLTGVAPTTGLLVDATTPAVLAVAVPGDGSHTAGDTLHFTVQFTEAVTVDTTGGLPRIALTLGTGGTVAATYAGGSGTDSLVFAYTVLTGQLDTDGIVLGGNIEAQGGTLRDLAGNDAALLLHGVASTTGILVDAQRPVATGLVRPADGTYTAGQALDFAVGFDQAVLVESGGGLPRIMLALDTGGSVAASYVSGSGTDLLVFRYTVLNGQVDTNGIVMAGAIDANGGSLRDPAGNDAIATLAGLTPDGTGLLPGVKVDAVAPVIAITSAATSHSLQQLVTGTVGLEDAGATVRLQDGAVLLGSALVDASGHWSISFEVTGPGSLALQASVADAAGNATSTTQDLTVDFSANRGWFGSLTVTTNPADPVAQIYAVYEGLFDRAPDALGLEYWNGQHLGGASLADIAGRFLASQEYADIFGPPSAESDAGFVSELYLATFGRAVDAGGLTYWTDRLAAEVSRAEVAAAIATSPEHIRALAPVLAQGVFVPDADAADTARLYHGLLGRAPDLAGLANFTDVLRGGASLAEAASAILGSAEAQQRFATLDDAAFVTQIYADALGRSTDPGGLANWTGLLAQGQSRALTAASIAGSSEAQLHLAPMIEEGWQILG